MEFSFRGRWWSVRGCGVRAPPVRGNRGAAVPATDTGAPGRSRRGGPRRSGGWRRALPRCARAGRGGGASRRDLLQNESLADHVALLEGLAAETFGLPLLGLV